MNQNKMKQVKPLRHYQTEYIDVLDHFNEGIKKIVFSNMTENEARNTRKNFYRLFDSVRVGAEQEDRQAIDYINTIRFLKLYISKTSDGKFELTIRRQKDLDLKNALFFEE